METSAPERKTVRLAYAVSHPIQYQAPLLRRLAREPGIDLTVFYSSAFSAKGYYDRGFGREVQWDVPLLNGYKFQILPRLPGTTNINSAMPPSYGYLRAFTLGRFDAVWVHGYSTANSLHALMAARAVGADTLVRTDSTLLDRERGPMKRIFRRGFFGALSPLVDCILTCGTMNAQYWSAMLPNRPQVLMPYAVDNEYFAACARAAAPQREQLRAELGFKPDEKIFLYAAKLIPRKRCGDLLQAMAKLRGEKARLLVAGDGAQRAELEVLGRRLFSDFGTPSCPVKFLGFRSQKEIPRWIDLADVFVLPSVHEPWGLVINEAMACGRCTIVSDEVGSAPDLVHDGSTGFVVPALDVEALAEAMRKFVRDPELSVRMGKQSAELINRWNFDADVRSLRHALRMPEISSSDARSVA